MKQQVFWKSIIELQPGDRIFLKKEDCLDIISDSCATVQTIRKSGTFTFEAEVMLEDQRLVKTKPLDHTYKFHLDSWENQSSLWVTLPNVEKGDRISWWSNTVEVEEIGFENGKWFIQVTDPLDGETKTFQYKESDALFVLNKERSSK